MEHLRVARVAGCLWQAFLFAVGCFLCGIPPVLGEINKAPYVLANQFSVVQTVQMDGGGAFVQHLYRDGDKLRVEVQQGPETQVIVLRKDQKKVYTILPAQKLVLESAYRDAGGSGNPGLLGEAGASWEWQGKETVHGRRCAKYLVKGNAKSVYVWLDEAGKHPLRVAPVDGKTVVDWDQYQAGPQPSDLFEPPADFRILSMNLPETPR
ncbi:protein of unknown function [Methylacidimicrobium sp. AP8]|uniref:hypothetical protein n=1 Tax=Methylacidimicrobium sp. AP8 TaxID=2730359 RepID=UPI0018BFDB6F|nr:hypothetical protein [Methylacidimicrobium sp. AP8]CAB4244549.1 protein of unknown function [Methylacidimicrobium sp. AP8]